MYLICNSQIANKYKNGQCGLCGHYDENPEDEYRMNNNELTNDLMQFHRSYLLQDENMCTTDGQQSFYNKYRQMFGKTYRTAKGRSLNSQGSAESSSSSNEDESNKQTEWDNQNFEGNENWFGSNERDGRTKRFSKNRRYYTPGDYLRQQQLFGSDELKSSVRRRDQESKNNKYAIYACITNSLCDDLNFLKINLIITIKYL